MRLYVTAVYKLTSLTSSARRQEAGNRTAVSDSSSGSSTAGVTVTL